MSREIQMTVTVPQGVDRARLKDLLKLNDVRIVGDPTKTTAQLIGSSEPVRRANTAFKAARASHQESGTFLEDLEASLKDTPMPQEENAGTPANEDEGEDPGAALGI